MSKTILLCTVGGSHQPILTAIKTNNPDLVCFFCTEGAAGSDKQVTGQGKVIKASPRDSKPTLPNIPTQAKADDWKGSFEVRIVPPDDLDAAFFVMRNEILKLAQCFPNAELVADYTGGTKTMTAALVSAVLATERVELQLVAGFRPDLIQVQAGTQHTVTASVTRLLIDRDLKQYLAAWRHFDYHEAVEGLKIVRIAINSPDLDRLYKARALSEGLELWDKFDHAGALAKIRTHSSDISGVYEWMLPTLGQLKAGRESALLFDLWLNAERRAAQGRFDDAVARWYRLVEWTAQWQLKTQLKADTADFPEDKLPPEVDANAARGQDKKIKLGLLQAWKAVAHNLSGPAKDFIAKQEKELLNLLHIRNHSILAHGFKPVSADDWRKISSWTQENFLPVLRELAQQEEPPQLPHEPPMFLTAAP